MNVGQGSPKSFEFIWGPRMSTKWQPIHSLLRYFSLDKHCHPYSYVASMATKQGEELANEYVPPAESINNANLQEQGRGRNGTPTVKADSQQTLIAADYLKGEVGKATESMEERSGGRSVQERKP